LLSAIAGFAAIADYFTTAGFAAIKQKIMAEERGVDCTLQDKGIRLCATLLQA
jgi:hypothetical protein